MSRRNRRERHEPPPRAKAAPEWQVNDRGTGAAIQVGGARGVVGLLELLGLVRWAILGPDGTSCHGFVEVPLNREDGHLVAITVARSLVEAVIGAYASGLNLT